MCAHSHHYLLHIHFLHGDKVTHSKKIHNTLSYIIAMNIILYIIVYMHMHVHVLCIIMFLSMYNNDYDGVLTHLTEQ